MIRILLVEDDLALGQSLTAFLSREGFDVHIERTLRGARAQLQNGAQDVVVLDWMLPDGQGIDLLKEVRARGVSTPVVLLTARAEVVDKVLGLELGANDYLTKPFEPRELVARLRVQARTTAALHDRRDELKTAGDIALNLTTRAAHFRNEPLSLTRMEFELLRVFVESPGKVFTRDELLNLVWGYEKFPTTRTVDTHVLQLRQKLDAELFETIRGVGYRLKNAR